MTDVVLAVGQLVAFPLVLTYWQSAYLRAKINGFVAVAVSWLRIYFRWLPLALACFTAFATSAAGSPSHDVLGFGLLGLTAGLVAQRPWRPRRAWSAEFSTSAHSLGSWLVEHVTDPTLVPDGGVNQFTVDEQEWIQTHSSAMRPMLYFRVDTSARAKLGMGRTVLAIVQYGGRAAPPRLQYDGDYPFTDAVLVHVAGGSPRSRLAVFLLEDPHFAGRQQGVADLRLNCVALGQELECAADVRVNRVTLLASGR